MSHARGFSTHETNGAAHAASLRTDRRSGALPRTGIPASLLRNSLNLRWDGKSAMLALDATRSKYTLVRRPSACRVLCPDFQTVRDSVVLSLCYLRTASARETLPCFVVLCPDPTGCVRTLVVSSRNRQYGREIGEICTLNMFHRFGYFMFLANL